jgi:diguanylate cyclase (GGDEF)-like protein/PAS domain S-box-containing protein
MSGGVDAQEPLIRAILDSLLDPVVLLEAVRDPAGRIVDFTYVDANTAALAVNGTTAADLIGDRVLNRFPEHGPSGLLDVYASVADTGTPIALNDQAYAHELFPGEVRYFDIRAAKVGDGITLTWRDRSDRHADRQALEEEQAQSRMTLDGLMDPVVLFAPIRDGDGRITDFHFAGVNEAACAYNQTTREELQGSLLSERYPDMWPLGMFDRFVDVVEHGTNLVADSWAYSSAFIGVERILDLRGHRVPTGLAVTWRDVTDRHNAALRLAESESRYRRLAENVTDVVFEVSADGEITWVSPSVEKVLRWTMAELVGTRIWELIPEEELPGVRESWYGEGHGTARIRTAGGDPLWGSFRVALVSSPAGDVTGAVIGLTDVSAVVEADAATAAAQAEQARNQLSMDEAAIGILRADLEGIVTYANPELHSMVGMPDGSLVGASVVGGSPEPEAKVVREMLRRVATGESEGEHLRRRLTHIEGTTRWVDTFMSPLRNEAGVIDGVLGQVVDVTAEVANRDALIRNAEHFRILAENASDVVYETNMAGQITWVSPSVLPSLGWEPALLLGTMAIDLVHEGDLDWVMRTRAEVYSGIDKSGLIARFKRIDGSVRHMSVSARAIHDADNAVTGAVVGLHDVTAEVLMQNRIQRSERMFRTAMVGAPQGMAIANAQDLITDVNPALETILGAEKVAILGLKLSAFVVPADPPVPSCAERLIESGESRIAQHERQLVRVDAPPAWIEHSVSAIRDDDGTPMLFIHHVVDVTQRRLHEDDLDFRAQHDRLTGLLNRDGLLTRLSDRMPVHGRTTLALLYCDLDNLKPINDQYGHAAGDALLGEVARRIESGLRRGDMVARFGGDEFVVVLDRLTSEEDALAVADKICQVAQGPVSFDGTDLPASVSMGLAIAEPGEPVESLLRRADGALYRAKAGGRGRVSR